MRIETNWRLAQRNRRLAHFLFFFSMAVLIGGFIVANLQLTTASNADPTAFALSLILPWIVLPIGFISTIFSVRMTNLWIRKPRPEDAIREGLKGISKKSILYNYYHFPARHVLIAPQGVFAMITRFQEGSFSVSGDKWRTNAGFASRFFRFFRRDDIGNPTADAQRAAAYVQSLIDRKMPGITVQPLVIFVDPRARLEISNPTVPVLHADSRKEPNLNDFMRDIAQKQQAVKSQPQSKKKGGVKVVEAPAPDAPPVIDTEKVADAFEEATLEAR